mmetsp:Transcript_8720/g.23411  ORF Transcript_8720/g.23411 Transcript_8720/m.23411 type:complete len:262 (+) Transcript_8720:752-1537(+)
MCDWLSTICFVDVGGAMDPPGSCGPNAELGMITGCSCRFSNSSTCCLSFADARIFSIGVKKLGITSLSSSPSSSGSSTLTAFCCCCCFLLALSSFIACAFCSSALAANVVFFSSSFSSSTLLVAFVLLLSFRFCNSLAFASAVNDASLILAISASFRSTSDIDFFEGTAASSPVVVVVVVAAAAAHRTTTTSGIIGRRRDTSNVHHANADAISFAMSKTAVCSSISSTQTTAYHKVVAVGTAQPSRLSARSCHDDRLEFNM